MRARVQVLEREGARLVHRSDAIPVLHRGGEHRDERAGDCDAVAGAESDAADAAGGVGVDGIDFAGCDVSFAIEFEWRRGV